MGKIDDERGGSIGVRLYVILLGERKTQAKSEISIVAWKRNGNNRLIDNTIEEKAQI